MDKKIFMISEVFTYKILHKNLSISSRPRCFYLLCDMVLRGW